MSETNVRLTHARSLMAGLRQLLVTHSAAEHLPITESLHRLESWTDGYLRHDLLEDSNEPVFFADFVDRVSAKGLRFFAEADVASMAGLSLPPKLADGAQRLGGSLVGREQLLDLLTNRTFRQSLLCRTECPACEQLNDVAIRSAYVVSTLRAQFDANSASFDPSDRPTRFAARGGFAIDVCEPVVAAALTHLQNAWPGGVWFCDLIAAANQNTAMGNRAVNEADRKRQEQLLADVILAAFVERTVELHTVEPAATTVTSDRPVASPLARFQAETSSLVTSLRHDVVRLDPWARVLIRHLDGTQNRAALRRLVSAPGEAVDIDVDAILAYFLRSGLLMP
ncbi:MAG: methyltransferase regulatory domain-containing protein [Fuerstia sp.]|nr:methyltransferase regulatory domain-containing protein [Fuerstiella sp.]